MSFTTEHAAMAKASRMVHDIADEVTKEQTRLDTEVTSFVGSGWTGVAAEEYRAAWEEWCRGMSDVLSALRTEAQLISSSQAAYEVSDDVSTGQMSPLSARLQSRLG